METSVNKKCKAFTSLEQSRKLAEILPTESADMYYHYTTSVVKDYYEDVPECIELINHFAFLPEDIPCWSLAVLLGVLPNEDMLVKTTDGEYYCLAKDIMTKHYDNPIDACYEMILKLYELKML